MLSLRTIARWSLILLAAVLTLLAATVVALRLGVLNQPALQQHLVAVLGIPSSVTVHYDDLGLSLDGLDVVVSINGARIADTANGRTLATLDHFDARLDASASLRQLRLVTEGVDIRGFGIDLYHQPDGGWGWFPGSRDNEDSGIDVSPRQLTGWVSLLVEQRGSFEQGRLTLHDSERQKTLNIPRLAIHDAVHDSNSDAHGTHVEGLAQLPGHDEPALSLVGELDEEHGLDGRIQLRVNAGQAAELGGWLLDDMTAGGWRLTHASGQATLWAGWRQGKLESTRVELAVNDLQGGRAGHALTLSSLSGRGLLERDGDHWRGWLNSLEARLEGEQRSLLPARISAIGGAQWHRWQLRVAGFELAPLNELTALMPASESIRQTLEHIEPRGRLTGLAADYDGQWQFRAGVTDFATNGWDETPGIGPINGWLSGTPAHGSLEVVGASDETRFALPGVFADDWQLSCFRTRFEWQRFDDHVSLTGRDLKVVRQGATIRGGFEFILPDSGPGQFNLDLELRHLQSDHPREWVPLNALDPGARQWLAGNLHRADVPRASVALKLVLDDDKDRAEAEGNRDSDRVWVSLDVRNASLDYLEGWPALTKVDGHVEINDGVIDARLTHANLRGLNSPGARAHLENGVLTASATALGDTGNVLGLLKAAPLGASLDDTIDSWQGHGPLVGTLNVTVPLHESGGARIDGNVRVDRADMYFRQSDLTVTDISGQLDFRYHNQQSDVSGDLEAHVFDGISHAHVDLAHDRVTVRGHARVAGVAGWLGVETVLPLVSGTVDYTGTLNLKAGGPVISADTSLKGLSMQLPPPFQKAPDVAAPLSLRVNIGQGRGTLTVADRIKARWRNDSHQGQAWLQQWPESLGDWPDQQHWEVYWQAPQINIKAWQTAISRLSGSSGQGSGTSMRTRAPAQKVAPIEHIDVSTACLSIGVQCLGSVALRAEAHGNDWQADLKSSFMQGSAVWHDRTDLPLTAHLDWLDVAPFRRISARNAADQARGGGETRATPADYSMGLKNLPSGQLKIDQLRFDDNVLGKLTTHWQADDQQLKLAPIRFRTRDATLNGQLRWQAAGNGSSLTTARMKLDVDDLGKTLAYLSLPDVIRTEDGRAQAQLAWPGAPWQFDLEKLTGRMGVELGNGRVTAYNSNIARIVGLLNLDNLFERLTLDFSDVTHSGISFRSLKGDATLYRGRLQTRGPIQVAGSATRFAVNGQVDFPARKLDGHIGITVPVTQNLPLAAVAIGAPQVGGVLWLFHELFKPWLSRVSSIHYHVWGPWSAPQIKLDNAQ